MVALRVAALVASVLPYSARASVPIDDMDQLFKEFMNEFNKIYDTAEMAVRLDNFKNNYRFIQAENAKGYSYTLGITEFADMTSEEFASTHLGYRAPDRPWGTLPSLGMHESRNITLPASVDWRTQGAVSDVKNQGQCGSCWAFSTTGALEGAWKLATGNSVSLSEKQLMDCSSSFGNHGCHGGLMDNGFQYAEQNAMCTEDSYPYVAKEGGSCQATTCTVAIPKGSVTGFKDVKTDDTQALMDAVAQQPVSIAIEADKRVFQLYKSGVLTGTCGTTLDHGVLLVGYGTTSGQDYWIVKNSWGGSWGNQGYIYLLRGKSGAGECGLKQSASYPVVSATPVNPAPPSPTPPVPSPSASTHYGKPPCRADEADASVQGTGGEVCAPSCDSQACPTDVPECTKAKPQCILQDGSTGKKYCALECMQSASCPAGAKCARVSGVVGICVYPQGNLKLANSLEVARLEEEINV